MSFFPLPLKSEGRVAFLYYHGFFKKKELVCDVWLTSRMFFRPRFFSVGCNPLLGHEVNSVCPDQLCCFFFIGKEENRPEFKRVEKKVQNPLHVRE